MGIPERFLALGDSFTIGTGTTPDRSFPGLLAQAWRENSAHVELLNPAVNGYTTHDLIVDELPALASFRPTLITLLIGANDIVQGRDERGYRAQLARIYERIRTDAPAARTFALPQPGWSAAPAAAGFGDPAAIARIIERFNAVAEEEAVRFGAHWIDLFPLMRRQGAQAMFAPDGLHPSAEAYAEWARELATALASSP